jgi:hypothetical protein
MSILETFEMMLADPNIEVKEMAIRAQEIEMYYEHNQLSEDEYKELVEDLLQLKSINKQMLSLDVQKKLDTYSTYLKNIKFFTGLI